MVLKTFLNVESSYIWCFIQSYLGIGEARGDRPFGFLNDRGSIDEHVCIIYIYILITVDWCLIVLILSPGIVDVHMHSHTSTVWVKVSWLSRSGIEILTAPQIFPRFDIHAFSNKPPYWDPNLIGLYVCMKHSEPPNLIIQCHGHGILFKRLDFNSCNWATYPLVNKHRPWKSPIFNGN